MLRLLAHLQPSRLLRRSLLLLLLLLLMLLMLLLALLTLLVLYGLLAWRLCRAWLVLHPFLESLGLGHLPQTRSSLMYQGQGIRRGSKAPTFAALA